MINPVMEHMQITVWSGLSAVALALPSWSHSDCLTLSKCPKCHQLR